jgi:putative restriction endonuclease
VLERGFEIDGRRVPLVGPQGIFKPAVCELPLSITTVPEVPGKERPYEDETTYEGVHYRYRGTDPRHPDNVGLRRAMVEHVPLVYFHGHRPGLYHAEWPVYVVGDDPRSLTFTILTEDQSDVDSSDAVADAPRRAYLAILMTRRLHQSLFRVRVLDAYDETCAVCRLRHQELLDAAHILPDKHPLGEPVVPNGLALCKLHHAAFDADILGVRPDLKIEVRHDVLREADGPMLKVGLQGFDGQIITVPRQKSLRPNVDFLAERFERFRRAG